MRKIIFIDLNKQIYESPEFEIKTGDTVAWVDILQKYFISVKSYEEFVLACVNTQRELGYNKILPVKMSKLSTISVEDNDEIYLIDINSMVYEEYENYLKKIS